MGRDCGQISEKDSEHIFKHYNGLGDLIRQRLFLTRRNTNVMPKKRKITSKAVSRQQNSRVYYLTVRSNKIKVCKKFFFNTLGIPERTNRTAISKINEVGVMERENKGGR